MPLWLTYGLLGVVAGPIVAVAGGSVARREPLSWEQAARTGWTAMLAASVLLGGALAQVAWRLPATAGAVSWLVIVGLLLTVVDWTCHRLPQPVVGLLLAGGVIQFGVTALVRPDSAAHFARAAAATIVVFAIAVTMALMSPGGWGAGDVTLSATVAFFLGWFSWQHVATGLLLAFVLGAATFGVLRARRTCVRGLLIAFGPALVFAPVCTIMLM